MLADARYIVEIRHGAGNYLAEVDLGRAGRDRVLEDLLAGQYENAARVYRLEDATAEFARALLQRFLDEGQDVPFRLAELVARARPAAPARVAGGFRKAAAS